jgi:hypothetical protein
VKIRGRGRPVFIIVFPNMLGGKIKHIVTCTYSLDFICDLPSKIIYTEEFRTCTMQRCILYGLQGS